jgi:uncharacterized membrane protein
VTASAIALHVIIRFLHVGSVILFLGSVFYAWQVLVPVLNYLPEDLRMQSGAGSQLRFRVILWTLLVLIVLSGLYNILTAPPHTTTYHIWFGVKMLLVLHLLATAILWSTSPFGDVTVGGKSKHRLLSMTISGLAVVLISAYLRSLTQQGL